MGKSSFFHCVFLVAFCWLSVGRMSEGKHGKRIPSAAFIGKVHKASKLFSGTSVVLECFYGMSSKHMFRKEAKMTEHGEFKVHLPALVSKNLKTIKTCSVKLMSSTDPDCALASTKTTTLVHLNSRKNKGLPRVFSAGLLTFSPVKQSSTCSQKRNLQEMKYTISKPAEQGNQKPNVNDQKLVPSTLFFPFFPFPPNPLQPPVIPPNPLLPPPSILPPVPGLTPPPSGIIPPVPGLTPPTSGILPPIPGLTPPPPASIFPPFPGIPTLPGIPKLPGIPVLASPPPPPPPSLLPPLPFPPGFPGIPPAASKSYVKP